MSQSDGTVGRAIVLHMANPGSGPTPHMVPKSFQGVKHKFSTRRKPRTLLGVAQIDGYPQVKKRQKIVAFNSQCCEMVQMWLHIFRESIYLVSITSVLAILSLLYTLTVE